MVEVTRAPVLMVREQMAVVCRFVLKFRRLVLEYFQNL
jgi:hypothetical protein